MPACARLTHKYYTYTIIERAISLSDINRYSPLFRSVGADCSNLCGSLSYLFFRPNISSSIFRPLLVRKMFLRTARMV